MLSEPGRLPGGEASPRSGADPFPRPALVRLLTGLLLALHFALGLGSLWDMSLTYDEPAHLLYGMNLLHGDVRRFDDSKMPASALNALPGRIAEELPPGALASTLAGTRAARTVTLLASLLLALLVRRWATELYGPAAGLLALALYCLDPNLIAHGSLVTTDLYAALGTTAALYALWRFRREPRPGLGMASALTLGAAQLAKYSCVFLYPITALLAVLPRPRENASPRMRPWRRLAWPGVFVLSSLAVLYAGFLGDRAFTPLREYQLRSELFTKLQSVPVLRDLPVPTPYSYLEGLDWVRARERSGKGFGHIYLFGEIRKSRGFKGYYLWAGLFKEPLPAQALFLAALATFLLRRRDGSPRRDELYLLLPSLVFGIYFNFLYNAQIGIRYMLIVFPLLHIFSARLLRTWPAVGGRARWTLAGLLVWQLASVLSYFPHYIPYFNELVPDRRLAYKLLADSNLDWGQSKRYLERWLRDHPKAIVEPQRPTAGTIVVGANFYTGVRRPGRFQWLRRSGLEPVDHVGYSYLVFEVPTSVAPAPRPPTKMHRRKKRSAASSTPGGL